jgi:hypothetical protein
MRMCFIFIFNISNLFFEKLIFIKEMNLLILYFFKFLPANILFIMFMIFNNCPFNFFVKSFQKLLKLLNKM